MTNRRNLLALVVAGAAVSLAPPLWAQTSPTFAEGGVAIRGADPVAYFTEGRPVSGSAEHSLDWNGATWHFASPENRAAFEADPERYAPQYGGYCAYAAADGSLVPIDPEAWAIRNDRLYLNFSPRIHRRWQRDADAYIAAADANWPALIQ